MRLKEKVVLITGVTGDIGTAMTQRFLAEGASVCITGRSAEKLADISESLGAGAKLTTCLVDVLDEAAVLSSVERSVAEFGGIEAITANAGTEGTSSLWKCIRSRNSTKPFSFRLQAYGFT